MINYLLGSLLTIISIGFGYYLGKRDKEVMNDAIKVIHTVSKAITPKKDLGAVPRLTQSELDLQNNPLKQAENVEMGKLFSEIIPNGGKIE